MDFQLGNKMKDLRSHTLVSVSGELNEICIRDHSSRLGNFLNVIVPFHFLSINLNMCLEAYKYGIFHVCFRGHSSNLQITMPFMHLKIVFILANIAVPESSLFCQITFLPVSRRKSRESGGRVL